MTLHVAVFDSESREGQSVLQIQDKTAEGNGYVRLLSNV